MCSRVGSLLLQLSVCGCVFRCFCAASVPSSLLRDATLYPVQADVGLGPAVLPSGQQVEGSDEGGESGARQATEALITGPGLGTTRWKLCATTEGIGRREGGKMREMTKIYVFSHIFPLSLAP